MYLAGDKIEKYFDSLRASQISISTTEIAVLPPDVYISLAYDKLKGSVIKIGAQDAFYKEKGAYTGETSSSMIKKMVKYVLAGHSERRRVLKETDETINKKIKAILKNGLVPILCVGETEEAYKSGDLDMIFDQIDADLKNIDANQARNIIIAYEPLWAIGTKNPATADYANNICSRIRLHLSSLFTRDVAKEIRILYGGSINSQNAFLFAQAIEIDGLLVGEASANIDEFIKIIKNYK